MALVKLYYLSLLLLDKSNKIPGTKDKQLVKTTTCAESICGKAKNAKITNPITCKVSIPNTKMNS